MKTTSLGVTLSSLMIVTVIVGFAACGSEKAASPVSPSAAATAISVNVTFSIPRATSIKPQEIFQLRASATLSDGTTGDCTAAATWSSANEAVVKLTGQRPGEFTATGSGSTTVAARCGQVSGTFSTVVVSIAGVSVAAAPGHATTFTVGERAQLFAIATFSDGSTEDCTSSATWFSSDAAVALMTSIPGSMQSLRSGTTTVEATCRGLKGTLVVLVGPGLRITGAEPYPTMILLSTSIRLRAILVDGEGAAQRDCTGEAVWFSSSDATATMGSYSATLGRTFRPHQEGDVTMTASCGASVGQIRILTGHYVLNGFVRSSAGAPLAGALVGAIMTNSAGGFTMNVTDDSETLNFSRVGYESASRTVTWNAQPAMSAEFTMAALPEVFKQGDGVLCVMSSASTDPVCTAAGAPLQDVITFTVPRNGTLRFASHWTAPGGSSVPHDLLVTLTCNGMKLPQFSRYVGSGTGGGFTVAANTGCQYALTIQNATTKTVLPYQWTLNMQ